MIEAALDRLLAESLVDEDGEAVSPTVAPGLTESEIGEAERRLGHTYPTELRNLLRRTRGLAGLLEEVDFSGLIDGQALDEVFPSIATIAHDGYGNFWAVDLLRENGSWGPIWFLSHDPPVALFQCDGLAVFLDELARMFTPPHASLLDDVHEDRLFEVGRRPVGVPAQDVTAQTDDPVLRAFADEIGPEWTIVDVREALPGMGFDWGRYGPRTELRRSGTDQIFAMRRPEKRGLFRRRG